MTTVRTRGVSVASITAAVMIAVLLSGCGRFAGGGSTGSPAEPAVSDVATSEQATLDEIDRLLDDAESAIGDSELDATEGERTAGLGDEP